jgi:glycosyltransferase involved in cell wall biosynthesis
VVTTRRVSVVIPTRGRAAWCVEAVESALAQRGVDVEVVVALDGEQPELSATLSAKKDARLVVVSQPRAGRSATRNLGLRTATASLIAFLDDDDRLLPDGISVRVAALQRHAHAVLVHGPAVAMDAAGSEVPGARAAAARGSETCGDGLEPQLRGSSPIPSTVLIRREVVERIGGFDEDLLTGEDWVFFLRAAAVGPFVRVPEPTVLYRRHAGQVRGTPSMQEAALPRWTSRYFDDPRTPARARAARDRVVAHHWNWIARNYRLAGDESAFRRCFLKAVRLAPRLLLHPRRLARFVGLHVPGRGA